MSTITRGTRTSVDNERTQRSALFAPTRPRPLRLNPWDRDDGGHDDSTSRDHETDFRRGGAIPPAERGTRARTLRVEYARAGSLGSKQIVSIRGRRVEKPHTNVRVKQVAVSVTLILILGVVTVVLLSGKTTEMAFRLTTVHAEQTQLSNELEVLNRQAEEAQAAAEVAQQAVAKGMVTPPEPGIISVDENGVASEQSASNPSLTRKVIDLSDSKPATRRSDTQTDSTTETTTTATPSSAASSSASPASSAPGALPYTPPVRGQ